MVVVVVDGRVGYKGRVRYKQAQTTAREFVCPMQYANACNDLNPHTGTSAVVSEGRRTEDAIAAGMSRRPGDLTPTYAVTAYFTPFEEDKCCPRSLMVMTSDFYGHFRLRNLHLKAAGSSPAVGTFFADFIGSFCSLLCSFFCV